MDLATVNMRKIKAKAHRMSRRDSNGSDWFNPFRRINYGAPKRSSTSDAAERGLANSQGDTAELNPTSSAPGRLLTPIGQSARNSKDLEGHHDGQHEAVHEGQQDTYESQATTTLGNDGDTNSIVRHRGPQDNVLEDVETRTEDEKPKKQKTGKFFQHIEPAEPFTPWNQFQRVLLSSPINILLLAAPAGIALHFIKYNGNVVFGVNFIAIVPLAAMLSNATEEIAMRTGEVLGGLINASFGYVLSEIRV